MTEELLPYPGLRAFDRTEWATFFGRESHIEELLQRLKDHHFLAVIGESGSGKSSLMKAGVLHALEQGYLGAAGQHWCIAELRPGDQPFERLADALLTDATFNVSWNPDGERQAAFLTAALRAGSRSLLELLQQHPLPSGTRLLLLVDQFEELFRYEVEAQAEPFVTMLLTACRARQDIYVAITMRSDFLGDTVAFQGLPEAINDGLYLTPRLNREQLHAAITHPALLAGGEIEDTLANHLINEASTDPDQLPLLQHALMRLWQGTTKLTLADYQATQNTLKNALDQHAEEVWRTLSPAQQSLAETVFRALTKRNHDGKEIRRPVKFATLLTMLPDGCEDDLRAVLNAYRRAGCNFLMPPPDVPLHADTTLDISHESLMRQWQKLNRWVKAEGDIADQYVRLLQDATRWQAQQGEKWQGKNLEAALAWGEQTRVLAALLRHTGTEANRAKQAAEYALVLEFIEASRVEAERIKQLAEAERLAKLAEAERLAAEKEARRKAELKRVRMQRLWFLVGFVVTSGLAVWAWQERGHAQTEAEKSQRAEVQAKQQATRASMALEAERAEAAHAVQAEAAAKRSAQQANEAKTRAQAAEKHARQSQNQLFETQLQTSSEPTSIFIADVFKLNQQKSLFEWLKREIGKNKNIPTQAKNGWYARLPKMSIDQLTELVFLFTRTKEKLPERFASLAHEVSLPKPVISPSLPDMVEIPAGISVTSEEEEDDSICTSTSKVHKFQIGKYEVTNQQWRSVMGKNSRQSECDLCAATVVDFAQVEEFIRKLNAKTGLNYRLPTQIEWRYACLAGKDTRFCGGGDDFAVAWTQANSDLQRTHSVGMKLPNAWGLYDMSGNADELVQEKSPQVSEEGHNDIACGGAVEGGSSNCGAVTYSFADRWSPVGFRLARTIGSTQSHEVITQKRCVGRPVAANPNSKTSCPNQTDENLTWVNPAKGELIGEFSETKKGLEIAGDFGTPVVAAAPGEVVYSGSGLRGYGKLILIRHNATFITAYAHNRKLLVKLGQKVEGGEQIAEMGNTEASRVELYFELRKCGKVVDPRQYLPLNGTRPVPQKPSPAIPASTLPDESHPKPRPSYNTTCPRQEDDIQNWVIPAEGELIGEFSETGNQKGLEITGDFGTPVVAAAPGEVVYSGAGLRGYGKLILIKHNATFITAYAHNRKLLVKLGQKVEGGEQIAEMGNTEASRVELYFELRKCGKAVDPHQYLPLD